tara:strand:+ start:337 stop:468 length:132 start_codon:yes stop_codon:yes gene_type:complete
LKVIVKQLGDKLRLSADFIKGIQLGMSDGVKRVTASFQRYPKK